MPPPDPVDLQPRELLQIAAEFFESHGIPYRIVGSMASIAYGENRFTNDIDVVADLQPQHVDDLCACFQAPDYFVARHAVEDAIRKRSQFNIIHIPAGLKIDVMLSKQTEFAQLEQQRAIRLSDPDGLSAVFATPEDVILNKLIFFQLGGSEKHLREPDDRLEDAFDRCKCRCGVTHGRIAGIRPRPHSRGSRDFKLY